MIDEITFSVAVDVILSPVEESPQRPNAAEISCRSRADRFAEVAQLSGDPSTLLGMTASGRQPTVCVRTRGEPTD